MSTNFLMGLMLVFLFVSSWGRIIDRQRLGEISKEILVTAKTSISDSSSNILIYAFGFPFEINRFLIGSRSAKEIAPFFYWKNEDKNVPGKVWVSIDCKSSEARPLELKETMYALTLAKTANSLLKTEQLSYGIPKYQMFDISINSIRPDVFGIDGLFEQKFDRYVFCYKDGKVVNLTDYVFPKSKVIFRIKRQKIKNIALLTYYF